MKKISLIVLMLFLLTSLSSCKMVKNGFMSSKVLKYYHVEELRDYIPIETNFYSRTYPILDHEDVYFNIEQDTDLFLLVSSLFSYFSDDTKFTYCGYADDYYNADVYRSTDFKDYFWYKNESEYTVYFIYKATDSDEVYRLRLINDNSTYKNKTYNIQLRLDRPYNFNLSEEYIDKENAF